MPALAAPHLRGGQHGLLVSKPTNQALDAWQLPPACIPFTPRANWSGREARPRHSTTASPHVRRLRRPPPPRLRSLSITAGQVVEYLAQGVQLPPAARVRLPSGPHPCRTAALIGARATASLSRTHARVPLARATRDREDDVTRHFSSFGGEFVVLGYSYGYGF
jgi:hypothetical protein